MNEARLLHSAAGMRYFKLLAPVLLVLGAAPSCVDEPPLIGETSQEIINERNASVATGHQHSCAIAADTSVICWGRNTYGQLGDGTTTSSPLPVTVVGIGGAVAVTAGKYHSCAALADGSARCWGQGDSGQLGDGASTTRLTPVVVPGLAGVTSLSAGGAHTCATLANSQARCWGSNAYGQLGTNSTTSASTPRAVLYRASPTSVITLAGIAEIETGTWSTCARTSWGSVVCWGRNHLGQLGDGTTTQRLLPVAPSGLPTAVDVAVGDTHACAVLSSGRARCWGANLMGQLGDGTQTMRTTPVEMQRRRTASTTSAMLNISSAAAGQYHTCVEVLGELWCTGRNDDGQLGVAITPYLELLVKRSEPVVTVTEIAAGGDHTCVRRPAGNILCLGDDGWGQVGNFGRCALLATAAITGISAPASAGEVHSQGNSDGRVYYVEGNTFDVEILASACADVTRVDLRYLTIGDDEFSVEPSDGLWSEVLSALDRDDGFRQLVVRVHLVNAQNGTSSPLAIEVTSPSGATATATATIAEVLEVNPDHDGSIHISRQELINWVLEAMYDKFGDYNYWSREDAIDFHHLDYAGLGVFVNTDGVSFSASVRANLDPTGDACDPTVTVSGTFRLVVHDGAIAADWVHEPHGSASASALCTVSTAGLVPIVSGLVAEIKDDKVKEKIEKRIAKLGEFCDTAVTDDCDEIIREIVHENDSIRVTLKPVVDSVTFRQPYVSSQFAPPPAGTPVRRGIALPNEPVLVVTSGMAWSYGLESSAQADYQISPTGLFNWNWEPLRIAPADDDAWGPHPPIMDPWPSDYGYLPGRHGPWLRQRGLRRTLSELPMPTRNVGAAVGRIFDSTGVGPMRDLGSPCGLAEPTGTGARLVVGRNDRSGLGPLDGEYGTGEALVTLVFPSGDVGSDCPTE